MTTRIRYRPAATRAALAPLLAMLAAAGCGRADATPAETAGWGRAELVSQETGNGATPSVFSTAGGDRVLAWVAAPGGGEAGRLHVSVTPAGGAAPLPTTTIADPIGPISAHGEAPPQIAGDSAGRLYVMYSVGKVIPGRRFPASALRVVRSEDRGRTWSAPITINDTGELGEFGGHNFHNLVTGPDGVVYATWLDSRTGSSGVWMSRSRDGGRSWEPNRPIYTDPTCPCCRTAIAAGANGELYVAWRAILPGDVRDVVVMRSGDGGRTWDAPVRPREDGWVFPGCPHAGPSLRLGPDGAVHVAWWTGKEQEAGVYYARSVDRGRTWAAQPIGVGERSTPAHVQLAVLDSSRVLVAWDDGLSAMPRILVRRSTDGRTFGAPEVLSDSGVAATYPVPVVRGDSVTIAWSQMTEPAHREHLVEDAKMKDPKAAKGLPRVGQSEIFVRTGALLGAP